jgi:hypothetical protein
MNAILPRPHELRVAVVFGPHGKVRPVWFDLGRKRHDVRSITNSWHDRCGEIRLLHFHVTAAGALYELVFNQNEASWQLLHIEAL